MFTGKMVSVKFALEDAMRPLLRSTLPLILAIDGNEWSTLRPGRITPAKTRYPLNRRLVGYRKSGPHRVSIPALLSIAILYTDYAIPAQRWLRILI
jgi:hypothetical protein